MIRGTFLSVFWPHGHPSQPQSLTTLIQNANAVGFEVTHVYPCFYQKWEMDAWGALGTQEAKMYRLETTHGRLVPVRIHTMPTIVHMPCLHFHDEAERALDLIKDYDD